MRKFDKTIKEISPSQEISLKEIFWNQWLRKFKLWNFDISHRNFPQFSDFKAIKVPFKNPKISKKKLSLLTTFILAWNSRNFLLANTCICELTCFLVLVLPVLNFMYRAISSFRPEIKKKEKRKHKLLSNLLIDKTN